MDLQGADVPLIDCVLMARPTLSQNLFSQMAGRGLRLSPATGKTDCLIMDMVGNTDRGLFCAPTLFGLDPNTPVQNATVDDLKRQVEVAMESAPAAVSGAVSYQHPSLEDLLKVQTTRISRISSNAWVCCGGDVFVLELASIGYIRVTKEKDGGWLSRFYRSIAGSRSGVAKGVQVYQDGSDDSFSRTIRTCDTYADRILQTTVGTGRMLLRSAAWRERPATSSQTVALKKMVGDSLHRMLSMAGYGSPTNARLGFDSLKKGQAAVLFALCKHGARGRLQKSDSAQSRAAAKQTKAASRRAPKVAVGPLSPPP
jgi:ATP-dependent helicase IRC3